MKKICMQERMSTREDSGNGRSIIEVEGRVSLPLWLAEKNKWAHIQVSNTREGEEEENRVLLQAIRVLRNSLSSPQTVTSWSSLLKRDRTGSSASVLPKAWWKGSWGRQHPYGFNRPSSCTKSDWTAPVFTISVPGTLLQLDLPIKKNKPDCYLTVSSFISGRAVFH